MVYAYVPNGVTPSEFQVAVENAIFLATSVGLVAALGLSLLPLIATPKGEAATRKDAAPQQSFDRFELFEQKLEREHMWSNATLLSIGLDWLVHCTCL